MAKEVLRKVSDSDPKDLTKTYRPTKDWSMPLDRILSQLPPEALNPPGTKTTQQSNTSSEQKNEPKENKER